ncbi:hypothetical protein ES707_16971 [subsurface metagenome]
MRATGNHSRPADSIPGTVRKAIWLGLILTLISHLGAQINTEALRREDQTHGWHPSLGADLGVIAGNSSLLSVKGNLRLDYRGAKAYGFAVSQYQQGRKDDDLFINKGFAHLRGIAILRPKLHLEGFLQREFNDFIKLQDRRLVGGGLRFLFPGPTGEKPVPIRINLGTGLMWEQERLDLVNGAADPAGTNLLRSTNYIVLRWLPEGPLNIYTTAYYQVDTRSFSDYRITWEGGLTLALTKRIALTISGNLRYDHEPPPGVKTYDLDLTNGLILQF